MSNIEKPLEAEYREMPIPTTDLETIPIIYIEPEELPYQEEEVVPAKKRTLWPLVLIGLLALTLGVVGMGVIYPYFFARTTITLYAHKEQVAQNFVLTSIPVRSLTPVIVKQHKQVEATGYVTRSATQAQGTLVFYNSALISQTLVAGTHIGEMVVLDANVTIPPGTLSTNGIAQAPAHTLARGYASNIGANTLYGACCQQDIKVRNLPFTGGQDAASYHTPTQNDLDTTTHRLKLTLDTQAQTGILAQVTADETLLPTHCALTTTSDVAPGDAATSVTILVTETCTAQTYATTVVQQKSSDLLTQQAHQQYGTSYALSGPLQTTITSVTTNDSSHIIINVSLVGVYGYTLSPADIQRLKQRLAYMKRDDAYTYLLENMNGITKAQITGTSLDTLPDASRIDVLIE